MVQGMEQKTSKKVLQLIILDRDGVINQDSREFIKSPEEWRPLPGSIEAIAKLSRRGFKVVVATNQSGISRGLFNQAMLDRIHKKMQDAIEAAGGHLDGIFICPHGPEDNCECRKPKPGLLLVIAKQFNLPPEAMLSIGDSMRDLLAAKASDIPAILVKTGNGETTLAAHEDKSIPVYRDLAEAADAIIKSYESSKS